MQIKLIALDMDGTTLNDNHITMTKKNRRAISAAIAKGTTVVPATGRTYCDLPYDIKRIPGIRYVISSNGSSVIDLEKNEQIYSNLIEVQVAVKVLDILADYDAYGELYFGGKAYAQRHSFSRIDSSTRSLPVAFFYAKRKKVSNLSEFVRQQGKPIEKIEIVPSLSHKDELIEHLKELPITITTSGMNSIEITNLGANKGDALVHISQYLGIEASESMAIGDNFNDMEMLSWAGLSIAVANADDAIRNIADFVTLKNSQSGVAHAINRFVLSNHVYTF